MSSLLYRMSSAESNNLIHYIYMCGVLYSVCTSEVYNHVMLQCAHVHMWGVPAHVCPCLLMYVQTWDCRVQKKFCEHSVTTFVAWYMREVVICRNIDTAETLHTHLRLRDHTITSLSDLDSKPEGSASGAYSWNWKQIGFKINSCICICWKLSSFLYQKIRALARFLPKGLALNSSSWGLLWSGVACCALYWSAVVCCTFNI